MFTFVPPVSSSYEISGLHDVLGPYVMVGDFDPFDLRI